jgi:hypothetical protein
MTELAVIDGRGDGPPATRAQIVALQFGSIENRMSPAESAKKIADLCDKLAEAAEFACAILARDKTGLVDVVAEQPRQQIKELARDLEHAASIAQAFREDIRSASARLMVALAILDDDPLDDRGAAAVASVGGGVI